MSGSDFYERKRVLAHGLPDRALPFPHPYPHNATKHCSGTQPQAGTFRVRDSLRMEKCTRPCLSKFPLLCYFYLMKILRNQQQFTLFHNAVRQR